MQVTVIFGVKLASKWKEEKKGKKTAEKQHLNKNFIHEQTVF